MMKKLKTWFANKVRAFITKYYGPRVNAGLLKHVDNEVYKMRAELNVLRSSGITNATMIERMYEILLEDVLDEDTHVIKTSFKTRLVKLQEKDMELSKSVDSVANMLQNVANKQDEVLSLDTEDLIRRIETLERSLGKANAEIKILSEHANDSFEKQVANAVEKIENAVIYGLDEDEGGIVEEIGMVKDISSVPIEDHIETGADFDGDKLITKSESIMNYLISEEGYDKR